MRRGNRECKKERCEEDDEQPTHKRSTPNAVAPTSAAGSPRKGQEIISLLLDLASRDRARTPGSRPNPNIRDSKHDSDAIGWAAFFTRPEIVQILGDHATNAPDSSGY